MHPACVVILDFFFLIGLGFLQLIARDYIAIAAAWRKVLTVHGSHVELRQNVLHSDNYYLNMHASMHGWKAIGHSLYKPLSKVKGKYISFPSMAHTSLYV